MMNTFAYMKITKVCLTKKKQTKNQNHGQSRETSYRVEAVFSVYINNGLVSGPRKNPCNSARERQ